MRLVEECDTGDGSSKLAFTLIAILKYMREVNLIPVQTLRYNIDLSRHEIHRWKE